MSSGKAGYTQPFCDTSYSTFSSPSSLTDSVPIKYYSRKNHGPYFGVSSSLENVYRLPSYPI